MSIVMIWGGTRGLGRELARHSLARGHRTTVTGRKRPEDLEEGMGFVRAEFDSMGNPAVGGHDKIGRDFYAQSLNADILFWVVGHWLHKPLHECTPEEIQLLYNVHLIVPTLHLRRIVEISAQAGFPRPFHLVTIASSSAWKLRADGQAAYGAVQAAKVQFTRNFHAELSLLPLASTIVRPGGMTTEFFDGSNVDTSNFADPAQVAETIWRHLEGQRPASCVELDIAQGDGKLVVKAQYENGDPYWLD